MGQVKKKLASIQFLDNPVGNLDIELNIGPDGKAHYIHLQTQQWRMEFVESRFIQIANSIIISALKLKEIKKM